MKHARVEGSGREDGRGRSRDYSCFQMAHRRRTTIGRLQRQLREGNWSDRDRKRAGRTNPTATGAPAPNELWQGERKK